MLFAMLAMGLLAFNGWWFWRESQPTADTATIEKWIARKHYDQASAALRERLRRVPDDGDARIALARVLAARNELVACARELHKVPFWWPRKDEASFREGSVWMMLNHARDAEAAWLWVLRDDPLHPAPSDLFHDATLEVLKLYATEDRWEDLIGVIWKVYDLVDNTDREALVSWRIRSELERIAPTESIEELKRYVAADPGDVEALRALGRAEQALSHTDEARKHFEACLKLSPADPRAWRDLLTLLHETGDQEGFTSRLAQLPEGTDSEPELWKFRGIARETAGDLAGAAEAYRAAIERNPNLVEYHHRLALAEERLGHRDSAAEHRNRAKQLREARASLTQVFQDYTDARRKGSSDQAGLIAAIDKLTNVCDDLGWVRLSQALGELRPE